MHHAQSHDSDYPPAGGRRSSGHEKGHGSGLPATTAVGSGNGQNHSGSCCAAEETVDEKEKEAEPGTDKDTTRLDPAVRGGGNLSARSGRARRTRTTPTAGGSPRARSKRWEAEGAGIDEGTHSSEGDKGMDEAAAGRGDSEVAEDMHRDFGTDNATVTHNCPFNQQRRRQQQQQHYAVLAKFRGPTIGKMLKNQSRFSIR